MAITYYDDNDFYYDEFDIDYDWQDSCNNCGPWCEYWMGDGLCELEINQQFDEVEEYNEKYVTVTICPVCGEKLTQYEIPTDKLWAWPGDFYNPMIALEIYKAYGVHKGEIHRKDNICHIWTGTGKLREEKLIKLTG